MNRIIVTARNEVGVIADISAALAEHGINIESINAASDSGLVILMTDAPDATLRALADAGFRAVIGESLIVRLRDEPGALAKVAVRFKDAGINIQSLHILNRHDDHAHIVLSVEDHDRDKAVAIIGPEYIV